MQKRIKNDYSFDSWIHESQEFELERSKKLLASGKDPQVVAEELSCRLVDKIMHPIYKEWLDYYQDGYIYQSKVEYEENYIKRFARPGDHMQEDL